MIAPPRRGHITFGTFEVDLDAGEIRKAGLRVRLAGQPFRVLATLLSRPGEVITHEELQREIWGTNTNVDFERGLASAINKIRDALGDSADRPLYIETLSRRGYRFIAPLSVEPDRLTVEEPAASVGLLDSSGRSVTSLALEPETTGAILGNSQREDHQSAPSVRPTASKTLARTLAFGAIGAIALVVAASWVTYRYTRSVYRGGPLRIEQLTGDDNIYSGPPNPETLLTFQTDGPRIYAPILMEGRTRIASIDSSGTQIQPISIPDELESVSITDISRDGSKLLVRSLRTRDPEQPLWIVPTSGSGALRVGEVLAHDAAWMPESADGILVASGNDLDIVRLNSGAVVPYASLPGRAFWLRWSPDGKTLRFTLLDPITHTSSLWELDRSARKPHPIQFPSLQTYSVCCGSWTPSGDLYIFQATDARSSNLWAAGTGTHPALLQLTNGPLRFASPLASREGRVVYAFGSAEPGGTRLYDKDRHQFVPAPEFLSQAQRISYSRDGSRVAWTDTNGELWCAGKDGSHLLRLTGDDLEVYLARWSPDDSQLLLMARKPGETWQIYSVRADGGATHSVLSEKRNLADPDWSPDGRQVIFGREADLMGEESGAHDIEILDLQTGSIHSLPGSADLFSPRWSPDGRFVAALSRDQSRLLLFDSASASWKTLFVGGAADPAWSADSKSIYFHAFADPKSSILRVSLEGSLESIADLSTVGLGSMDNFFFCGVTPNGYPIIKPRIGTGNLYSIALPALR
jgi:Tol biopolymer transport system component/DNA-binding winged helix-turn-helix (wHTH) protein